MDVITSEFPSWEILKCFHIFCLHKKGEARRVTSANHFESLESDAEVDRHIKRIAKVFQVDHAKLGKQFHDLKPMAQQFANNSDISTCAAWKKALESVKTN